MKNKKTMILLVILAVLVIIAGGLLIYKIVTNGKTKMVGQEINTDSNLDESDTLVELFYLFN